MTAAHSEDVRAGSILLAFALCTAPNECSRLCSAFKTTDCLKLLIDSFGPRLLQRIAVVFTRGGAKSVAEVQSRATGMATVLRGLTGIPVETFPVYQFDAHVATDARFSTAYIGERQVMNSRALTTLAAWLLVQTAIPTADFKIGEYAETKRIREEQERAEEQRRRADAEAAARQAAEQRAREAEAAARHRGGGETFLNDRGFKIGGHRIW